MVCTAHPPRVKQFWQCCKIFTEKQRLGIVRCLSSHILRLKGKSHQNLLCFYWYHWKAKKYSTPFLLQPFLNISPFSWRIFDVKISTPTCTPLKKLTPNILTLKFRHANDDIFQNGLSKIGVEYF
jgi:hypothetical protein